MVKKILGGLAILALLSNPLGWIILAAVGLGYSTAKPASSGGQ